MTIMTPEYEVAVTIDSFIRFISRLDAVHDVSQLETIRTQLRTLLPHSFAEERNVMHAVEELINYHIKEFGE